jgi:hypothetical protein
MKKGRLFSFAFVFSLALLTPNQANARCYEGNYIDKNGYLIIVKDCYFLGIRYSHTETNMGYVGYIKE